MTEPTSPAYEFENENYWNRPWSSASPFVEDSCPGPTLAESMDSIIAAAKQYARSHANLDEPDYSTPFAEKVLAITDAIAELLVTKNAQYGDSALNPVRIFSKANPEEQLRIRADDKLSRIARGDGSGDEDAIMDLIGYLILLQIARMEEK